MKLINAIGLIGVGYMAHATVNGKPSYYRYRQKYDPTYKEYFHELIINKLDYIFYGGPRHSKRSYYSAYYNSGYNAIKYNRKQDNEYLFFKTRVDAEATREDLIDLINQYGKVTVADLKDLAGVQGQWADNSEGWIDVNGIKEAKIIRVGIIDKCWMLDLPDPIHLD